MTIAKGQSWGRAGPLPADGVVVSTDAEAAAVVAAARTEGRAVPPLGLLGGDLCRTLGGRGDAARLRSADAVIFTVDLGSVATDDGPRYFVAHAVAHNWAWTRATAVMNGAWLGPWNVAPRSHPNDGLLDLVDARLRPADLLAVRRRLATGAHLPHPRIRVRRGDQLAVDLGRPRRLWLDGRPAARVRRLEVAVEADALTVVV